jgi:ABC-2 type transport system ATP-binding protein
LDLTVPTASIYGLLGPNGAGKTTTIRMVMDIIKPDTGSITLLGSTDAEERRDRIGYLPEERGIYRKMKVRDLLVYFGRLRRMRGAEARTQADRWMSRFDLSSWAEQKIESLSKGMAQKVQFIATVIHRPEAVILDEPFAGFDPVNVDLVKDILLEFRQEGMTIILSTHQMETVEKLCDSICLINKGKKVLDGPLQQIKSERGAKAIQIEYQGRASFFRNPLLVESFDDTGRFVEVLPVPGISPQQILEAAMREVTISRFQLMEPSLHRIFVETVRARGGEVDGEEAKEA